MPGKRHSRPPPKPTVRVDLREALANAVRLHQQGKLDAAQQIYERVLGAAPRQANAMHFLGVLHHQKGRSELALAHIQRSIELDPTVPGWYNNLGNVLLESRRLAEAANAYQKACEMSPRDANLLNNLGALRRAEGRVAEAEAAYRRAMELNPGLAEAYNNLGNLYRSMGRIPQALEQYCEALIRNPKQHHARKMLGIAYYTLRRFDEAAQVYRQWLAEEPDNPAPRHYLAACTGEAVPDRAEDGYVEATFDEFANSFDASLENLTYRAPQHVAQAVARLYGAPAGALQVLDVGCGTGLCGPLLAPFALRLVGADLSAGMLAKAQPRKVYHQLIKAELTGYLQSVHQAFDLVISADTLCYFGKLEAALNAAHGALRPGGRVVFTLERLDSDPVQQPYRLNPHGRYSHSRGYVEQVLAQAGFERVGAEPVILRDEGGVPVQGWLMTAQRA